MTLTFFILTAVLSHLLGGRILQRRAEIEILASFKSSTISPISR
jgi:hypothetical protein